MRFSQTLATLAPPPTPHSVLLMLKLANTSEPPARLFAGALQHRIIFLSKKKEQLFSPPEHQRSR